MRNIKDKALSLLRRIESVDTPIGGVGWQRPVNQADVLRKLFNELEQRRVLYVPHSMEVPDETIASVVYIRGLIVDALNELPADSNAIKSLKRLAKACRAYLDNGRINESHHAMGEALDTLRAVFGAHPLLSDEFGVSIDGDLREFVPDPQHLAELRQALE